MIRKCHITLTCCIFLSSSSVFLRVFVSSLVFLSVSIHRADNEKTMIKMQIDDLKSAHDHLYAEKVSQFGLHNLSFTGEHKNDKIRVCACFHLQTRLPDLTNDVCDAD